LSSLNHGGGRARKQERKDGARTLAKKLCADGPHHKYRLQDYDACGGEKIREFQKKPRAKVMTWNLSFEFPDKFCHFLATRFQLSLRLGIISKDLQRVTHQSMVDDFELFIRQAFTDLLIQ
jgi:hypothetical protein